MSTNYTTTDTRRRTDHAPDPYLMDWAGANLPDAQSYYITDVDMIIRDRAGNLLIAEIKRRAAELNHHQRTTYELIDKLIRDGIKANPKGLIVPSMRYPVKLNYLGVHLLQFENTTFEDGQVYWNRTPVKADELRQILSFEKSPYI